jgi:hypothetical protein
MGNCGQRICLGLDMRPELALDQRLAAMSYTLADVDAAELRILNECARAVVQRYNFGWSLAARKDKDGALWSLTVFDSGADRPTIMPHGDHDLDWVIRTLNE